METSTTNPQQLQLTERYKNLPNLPIIKTKTVIIQGSNVTPKKKRKRYKK